MRQKHEMADLAGRTAGPSPWLMRWPALPRDDDEEDATEDRLEGAVASAFVPGAHYPQPRHERNTT
jgi:hypothetical protein